MNRGMVTGVLLLALGLLLVVIPNALNQAHAGIERHLLLHSNLADTNANSTAAVSAEVTEICGAIASVLGVIKLIIEVIKSVRELKS